MSPVTPISLADLLAAEAARDRRALEAALLAAAASSDLTALFTAVVDGGHYDRLVALLTSGPIADSPALRALAAARPTYGAEELNAPTLETLRAADEAATPYHLLVVPGFTPVGARAPLHLDDVPAARRRLDLAIEDLWKGAAPAIFVTGGSVHPPGTPNNEALMMRDYLTDNGVAPYRILVDPHARHSTTNLRNAGRALLSLGRSTALVVTGFESEPFSQAFYFGHPLLSTFELRCRQSLGYAVGDLAPVDEHRITYRPAPEVTRPDWRDPLDF